MYNLKSISFTTLFLSILISNIANIILPISLLNKPIPRILDVLETSLFLVLKSLLGKLTLVYLHDIHFLWDIFADKLFTDSFVTVISF